MSFGKFVSELASGGPKYLVDRVTGLFDDDISPTSSEQAAQAAGNDARDRLYTQNASLSQGFSGDFTSPVVPQVMETFVGMPHARIMEFIDSIGLAQMSESVQAWKTLATDTTAKATAFHDGIAGEMKRGWAGTAADSALAAVTSYLGDVHKVDQSLSLIANKMEEAYTGFQQVTYQVPHPSEARADGTLAQVVSAVGDRLLDVSGMISGSDSRRAKDAEDKANEVMRTVYAPVAQQADAQVPKVPLPATQESKPQDAPTPGQPQTPGTTGNPSTTPSTTTTPETPTEDDPVTEDDPTTTNTEPDTDTTDQDSTSTTPAATTTAPGTTTPTTPAGTTTPSGLGSLGTPGTGSPGTGSPGSTPGSPGSSVPGTGVNAGATAAGTGTNAGTGRAGASGMSGMGGMPGRGGNGKDDENEHSAPDYLRGVHEELLGPERRFVPPVIGDQE